MGPLVEEVAIMEIEHLSFKSQKCRDYICLQNSVNNLHLLCTNVHVYPKALYRREKKQEKNSRKRGPYVWILEQAT